MEDQNVGWKKKTGFFRQPSTAAFLRFLWSFGFCVVYASIITDVTRSSFLHHRLLLWLLVGSFMETSESYVHVFFTPFFFKASFTNFRKTRRRSKKPEARGERHRCQAGILNPFIDDQTYGHGSVYPSYPSMHTYMHTYGK
jgi:hypothetical protein